MATRQETARRRSQLAHELRASCRAGEWAAGELIPSINVLARRHQISAPVVHDEVRKLVEEGLLYAVPGVGTFVSEPNLAPAEPFLFLRQDRTLPMSHENRARRGFEERIAALGGAVISLSVDDARGCFEPDSSPSVAGVCDFNLSSLWSLLVQSRMPLVRFGYLDADEPQCDAVHFDDIAGGARATQHLLGLGHRKIGFLGLHRGEETGIFRWSWEREQGWLVAMQKAGLDAGNLSFGPDAPCAVRYQDQIRGATEIAAFLVRRDDITAVVAANSFAARGVLRALQQANVPAAHWPALVCFDSVEDLDDHVISALSLSWEEVGRQAAELLWQRAIGQRDGAAQQRLVPMQLIPRLSCRPDWAQNTRVLQRHAAYTGFDAVYA